MSKLYEYLNLYDLELTTDSGQEIERNKGIFYTHTGIILGRNKYSKVVMVFHNHPDSNPSIVSFDEFREGQPCRYTNRQSGSMEAVLLRSFSQVDSGYSYSTPSYNCQHATTYAREGQYRSHGVENTLGFLLLAVLFKAFTTDSNTKR